MTAGGSSPSRFSMPCRWGLSREKFMTRIETVICEATNRLVAAEQAELFARAPVPVKA
jgi:hypothetical protein